MFIKLNNKEKRIVSLAALGGMLEFYDFIIYGIFSVYFAHQFFPTSNPLLAIIQSYVIFILGYLARPIGGIIFSHIGDEYGRKKVLIITIILMGTSSLGIGILPTYNSIGIIAPFLLLILRLIQGLALGGELPSTYVYIKESMPNKLGSGFGITMFGVNSGLLLGMLINQLLNLFLTQIELVNYGWRIPFIFGACLCLISYKIRKTLQETKLFSKVKIKSEFPLFILFKTHLAQFIIGTLTTSVMSSLVVVAIVFMPTYLHEILKIDNKLISYIMPFIMALNVITIYLTGIVANTYTPHKILSALLLSAVALIPISYLLISKDYLIFGLAILSILEGVAAMIIPLFITNLFPTEIRLTGVALCYNFGFTIFGGLAPILISSMIKFGFNIYLIPVVYLIINIFICTIGLLSEQKINSA